MTKPTPEPTPAGLQERLVTMRATPTRPGVEHAMRPLVPGARYQVICNDCGAAFDSAAATEEAALAEVRAVHDPRHVYQIVTPVLYDGLL